MAPHRLADSNRVEVAGAAEVLDAFVGRCAAGMTPGIAAARSLAAANLDWRSGRREILTADRSVVLADHPDGPVLAAKRLDPATPTTVHGHGCAGAAIVVEGHQRYERYERFQRIGDATARLESIHDLLMDDIVWWGDPPDDLHRQTGMRAGAIELILLARPPSNPVDLMPEVIEETELRAAVVAAFLDGDVSGLEPWYYDCVLADVNAPHQRFQICGRAEVLGVVEHEEFAKLQRRLTFLRATDTADGLLLETELRYTEDGELRHCREAHNLRCRGGRIVEHVVWCTGVSDAETARQVFESGEIQRL